MGFLVLAAIGAGEDRYLFATQGQVAASTQLAADNGQRGASAQLRIAVQAAEAAAALQLAAFVERYRSVVPGHS